MFGDKKYRGKVKEIVAATMQQLDERRKTLAGIEALPDAGERYAALAAFPVFEEPNAPSAPAQNAVVSGVGTLGVAGFLASIIAIPLDGGLTLFLSLLGGGTGACFSAAVMQTVFNDRLRNVIAQETIGLTKAIKSLDDEVAKAKQDILDNELKGIAASAKFNHLYKNFPEVEKAFTMAAAREKILGEQSSVLRLDKKRFNS